MPSPHFARVAALALLLQGCLSTQPASSDLDTQDPAAATAAAAVRLRGAFTAEDGLNERMMGLVELENQALDLLDYEPLKLGAIGSTILDLNYGSLSGHYMLQRFYEHVEAPDAAALHDAWVTAIKTAITQAGTGEQDSPLNAISPVEAQIYMRSEQLTPVGLLYQAGPPSAGAAKQGRPRQSRRSSTKGDSGASFVMLALGRPQEGPLRALHFALSPLYRTTRSQFLSQEPEVEFSPLTLMGLLARRGDPAAQTALGALLMARRRLADAIGWLQAGARFDNVIANNLLARVHLVRASRADTPEDRQEALDEVLENYLHAIALGSPNAMHSLAALYLDGAFGEDNINAGVPLLRQAGDLNNSDALLYLAYLHYSGEEVEQDLDLTERYFVRAAVLNNAAARIGYARYLMQEQPEEGVDGRPIAWLEEVAAESDDPEAMLMLGNLHARGVATRQNLRTARRWYRKAAEAAPQDASIINEVAWTLTVSDLERLRRARYANRIMTEVMKADQEARAQPEYLDTWAATYAARGDFDEAVRLQEMALQKAVDQERDDVLQILEEHLDLFLAGKPVVEPAP